MSKFYHFRQNNSGGHFIRDEFIDVSTIIEAKDADEANKIAENIGIYFNGCDRGIDCKCCGDRWSPVSEYDAEDGPSVFGEPATNDSEEVKIIRITDLGVVSM